MKTKVEIEKMSVSELRQEAAALKLKNYSRMSKEILKKEILSAQSPEIIEDDEKPTITETILPKEVSESELRTKVGDFLDGLVESKDNAKYEEVLVTLGGSMDDDIDDLLEEANIDQLNAALLLKPIEKVKTSKTKVIKTPKEKKEKAPKKERISKDVPREGSKSEEILAFLKANPEMSVYKVAKTLKTYYSVVKRVSENYLNASK